MLLGWSRLARLSMGWASAVSLRREKPVACESNWLYPYLDRVWMYRYVLEETVLGMSTGRAQDTLI